VISAQRRLWEKCFCNDSAIGRDFAKKSNSKGRYAAHDTADASDYGGHHLHHSVRAFDFGGYHFGRGDFG
jgi:hypothetical protein